MTELKGIEEKVQAADQGPESLPWLEELPPRQIVADLEHSYLVSGSGELIEPDDGIIAIGSGGNYALAAARALISNPKLSAREVVQRSLEIAADICVFTNRHITVLELPS